MPSTFDVSGGVCIAGLIILIIGCIIVLVYDVSTTGRTTGNWFMGTGIAVFFGAGVSLILSS
jgi:hypothetical protein